MCALGPGRWICRYLVVVSAGLAIAGALLTGIALKPETERERRMAQVDHATGHELSRREQARNEVWRLGLGLPLSLLVCQLPLVWNRSYRGWRIAFRETQSESPQAELLKFGLSDLLGGTAGAAVALAAWRLEIAEILREPSATQEALAASFSCVFLSLIAGSFVLPLVPMIFVDRPRHRALASAAAYVSGIVMVLIVALLWLNAPVRTFRAAVAFFAYLAAIASSTLAVFWIGRELGYRFLRARKRGLFERWSVPPRVWQMVAKVHRLNRVFVQWAAVACTTIAGACILFWVVSLCTAKANLGFAFGLEDEITVARGTVTISAIVSSRSARQARLTPSKPRLWKAPGLEVEHLEDYGGRTWLTVKSSLLIPGLAAAILAAFFIRRYNRSRNALAVARLPES